MVKEIGNIGKLVIAFVAIIIAAVLIGQLALTSNAYTQLVSKDNSVSLSSLRAYPLNQGIKYNETLRIVNNETPYNFSVVNLPMVKCNLFEVFNSTDGTVVNSGNYTWNSPNCSILTTATSEYLDGWLNVSFTYNYSHSWGMINSSIETYLTDFTSTLTGWKAGISDCDINAVTTSTSVTNNSLTLTKNTDYKISSTNGSLTFMNTANVNGTISNNTVLNLKNCPEGYVYGWSATLLNLTYGLLALAALGVAIWMFYSIAKQNGIV